MFFCSIIILEGVATMIYHGFCRRPEKNNGKEKITTCNASAMLQSIVATVDLHNPLRSFRYICVCARAPDRVIQYKSILESIAVICYR
jgi:hypothetical protein